MGREIQKKKRRSGRKPIRQSNKTKKILNPRGNLTIAENWDKSATLAQNYRRLGLVSRLRTPAGGIEGRLTSSSSAAATGPASTTPFSLSTTQQSLVREARVERGPDGRILRVLRANPLDDPLADSGDEDGDGDANCRRHLHKTERDEWAAAAAAAAEEDVAESASTAATTTTDVVRKLARQAREARPPRRRFASQAERDWLGRLVERHGRGNTEAMARDRRLNPMQQTAADIAGRLARLEAASSEVA